ncbi:MAG: hypothetical protein R6X23_12485 [Acidimicrobiia bacterium]
MSGSRLLVVAASVVVVGAVVAGIFVAGTPAARRAQRLDDQRVSDLRGLVSAVERYQREYGRLPDDLESLGNHPGTATVLTDPESGSRYDYRVLDASEHLATYELCATFATASTDRRTRSRPFRRGDDFWRHPSGRHCFTFEIDRHD